MKTLWPLLLLLLSLAVIAAPASPDPWLGASPRLDISAAKVAADVVNVHAWVRDSRTGTVLAAPVTVVKAGTWSSIEIGDVGIKGAASVALSVTVDPSGHNVAYFAQLHNGDGSTNAQNGTLAVSR
jgi:hypothetical protein